ncbi:hypothetical protein IHE45_09G036600 [Dioscorea alata]|uniref:Uncharacterized protein n=1 Tax=Dioscorea alata TaxID=55571 RepID=A0ACB7VE39_DIOAL|nr:hypothetical protein IHE45_09G036600 [Dioscorea alata]
MHESSLLKNSSDLQEIIKLGLKGTLSGDVGQLTELKSLNKALGLDLLLKTKHLQSFQLRDVIEMHVKSFGELVECSEVLGDLVKFSSRGIIRLPKFEMTLTKAETNQKPVLTEDDAHIVTMYGRIYWLQLDRLGMLLYLYRFHRDVVQQGSLPVYSGKIAVSFVDNVLLIHQVDAKVVILYDIFLDSLATISAPLPLLLRSS